ncbi:glycerophosphodiester phosphodiesterase [Sporosarcina sp. ACRSM]|uniref:glycerophosphodiester phosphodiesterase family protein n=1 Tax=Sporosarcina sp. ACRSM TaxID=2918216 RepID=UPI001EF3F705|nr:glycerophosphodiester phosphodiesterase family protein [Sporosarcina sp. ACRSM]MCG7334377.1 glycerophosphodiester phosphodiesterase [Sporosarcina sp. ACRSM]
MKKLLFVLLCATLWLTGCGKDIGPMPEDEFLVIAHRGASAYVPENTLASYELAEDLDADYIELDIHLTKDGEMVVMHDQDVESTMNASGKISEFTLEELKKLSKKSRYQDDEGMAAKGQAEMYAVPALREVFDQFEDRMNFIIELKNPEDYPGIEEKLMDLLEANDMIGSDEDGHPKAVIQSFSEEGLEKIHALNPKIPLLRLISFEEGEEAQLTTEEIEKLQTYAAGIGVSYEALTEPFISYMQQQGLVVYAYTVNDQETALRMKDLDANGIHTDRPDILEK